MFDLAPPPIGNRSVVLGSKARGDLGWSDSRLWTVGGEGRVDLKSDFESGSHLGWINV